VDRTGWPLQVGAEVWAYGNRKKRAKCVVVEVYQSPNHGRVIRLERVSRDGRRTGSITFEKESEIEVKRRTKRGG